MPKVLIADALSSRATAVFESRGIEYDVRTGLKPSELKSVIGGYDGLAVRSATKVTAEVLAAARHLKVIGRAGIGVDNIDVGAATQRGIVVMNTPFGNSMTTAEHAVAEERGEQNRSDGVRRLDRVTFHRFGAVIRRSRRRSEPARRCGSQRPGSSP